MEFPKPIWLPDERRYSQGTLMDPNVRFLTDVSRGHFVGDLIKARTELQRDGIKVLDVGIGAQDFYFSCAYEPFMIAAELAGFGDGYQMDIVEKEAQIINDFMGIKKLFLATSHYMQSALQRTAWDNYLQNTRQGKLLVPYSEDEIKLRSYSVGFNPPGLATLLREKFFKADIPTDFQPKLESGDISLICDDIAKARIGLRGDYDIASCTNVLYLLTPDGQKLALYNMARSLKVGGLLVITDASNAPLPPGVKDRRNYTGGAVLATRNGWLNRQKLLDLHLKVDTMLEHTTNNDVVVLRRI